MHQQRDPDEAHDAGNAADPDRHPLLEGVRDAERVEYPDRRQQAAEMAKEDDQDADMEQVGAPGQLPAAQELARSAAPGVLLAVEAQHAAEQEHGQAEIGIPAENDVIDQFGHDHVLIGAAGRWGRLPPACPARAAGHRGYARSARPCSRRWRRDRKSPVRPPRWHRAPQSRWRPDRARRAERRLRPPSAWPPPARPAHGTRLRKASRACAIVPPWRPGYARAGPAYRGPPGPAVSREIPGTAAGNPAIRPHSGTGRLSRIAP